MKLISFQILAASLLCTSHAHAFSLLDAVTEYATEPAIVSARAAFSDSVKVPLGNSISFGTYERVRSGMLMPHVFKILGREGTLTDTWINGDGKAVQNYVWESKTETIQIEFVLGKAGDKTFSTIEKDAECRTPVRHNSVSD